jgi:hypothetical protein
VTIIGAAVAVVASLVAAGRARQSLTAVQKRLFVFRWGLGTMDYNGTMPVALAPVEWKRHVRNLRKAELRP